MAANVKADLFDTLTRLFTKESLDHLDDQIGSPFILLRFLAFDSAYVEISKELEPYMSVMTFKQLCVFLQSVLPEGKGLFVKNLAPKLASDDLTKAILKGIMNYFNCSESDAFTYKELLEKQGLELDKFFGINISVKKRKL